MIKIKTSLANLVIHQAQRHSQSLVCFVHMYAIALVNTDVRTKTYGRTPPSKLMPIYDNWAWWVKNGCWLGALLLGPGFEPGFFENVSVLTIPHCRGQLNPNLNTLLIHLADPQSRPVVIIIFAHVVRPFVRPSVPTFQI